MRRIGKFLPLIALYIVLVVVSSFNIGRSDQARYVWYAENLANDFFTTRQDVNLWSGPGYPLLLSPFAALGGRWAHARFLNVALLFGAVVYLYLLLRAYTGQRIAIVGAYLLGLWPSMLAFLPRLMTEIPAVFLVCAFMFHLSRACISKYRLRLHLLVGAAMLAYLIHTRVLFAYVTVGVACIIGLIAAIKRTAELKRGLILLLIALAFSIPYLTYTYSLTHKIFYWATSGGLSLYWISSPYEGDLGEWHQAGEVLTKPELERNHGSFFRSLANLSEVERDEALKRKAIENIKSHPGKFLKNWFANLGRLLLGYPFPRRHQNLGTFLYMLPGVFVIAFSALAIYPTLVGRRRVPVEIWVLLLFGLVSFVATSLLSAFGRLFLPIFPVVIVWWMFVLTNCVSIEFLRTPKGFWPH